MDLKRRCGADELTSFDGATGVTCHVALIEFFIVVGFVTIFTSKSLDWFRFGFGSVGLEVVKKVNTCCCCDFEDIDCCDCWEDIAVAFVGSMVE